MLHEKSERESVHFKNPHGLRTSASPFHVNRTIANLTFNGGCSQQVSGLTWQNLSCIEHVDDIDAKVALKPEDVHLSAMKDLLGVTERDIVNERVISKLYADPDNLSTWRVSKLV